MLYSLVVSEILFSITYIIAFFVFLEFFKSRDGILRKIMIAYFLVEVFVYLSSAVYFLLFYLKLTSLNIDTFAIVVTVPKVWVKIWLLSWLKKGKPTTIEPNTKK